MNKANVVRQLAHQESRSCRCLGANIVIAVVLGYLHLLLLQERDLGAQVHAERSELQPLRHGQRLVLQRRGEECVQIVLNLAQQEDSYERSLEVEDAAEARRDHQLVYEVRQLPGLISNS
ncbi:hypothetical protein E2562_030752 [Oryza meyeriana var. granulata]|uniref:Uncharacterized protein n=1 Tax=Oryza meyeriana var. granulata TaxID=110450 RepID=A0A6G1E4D1_9ORYZ|nr:hypothetical protein E2562_030752 [Oryza meyeriana var. granulata]